MIRHNEPLEHLQQDRKPFDPEAVRRGSTARLAVRGVGCANCEARVHNALLALDAVSLVKVFRWEQTVLVAYDAARLTPPQLAAAVRSSAPSHCYEAEVTGVRPAEETLEIDGDSVRWHWPNPAPLEPQAPWG
ncbi:heavy-metal-associated domain-containing protein [uncultured Meiothermus sp.]|uniref:heavy-metal-associated domain-containing protein n=1 Tax=uncultured Meiothermus sp. TaxID=157471 RepID=UPI002625F639|nr:heavy-metal-associated domain-containing protein [uncultured Meiothermus sp.]